MPKGRTKFILLKIKFNKIMITGAYNEGIQIRPVNISREFTFKTKTLF